MQGTHDNIISALCTDSYKLVMAYTFFCNGMQDDNTAFELFFRKCPFGGSYAIFAGLKETIAYIQNFHFTQDEVKYLKEKIFPKDAKQEFFDYLLKLDCSQVKVRAPLEGSLCFPDEPILTIEGPQGICQIIETPLINLISFPTLIATNATRMRSLAGPKAKLIEFGLRRAQGPDGAFSATQYSYLGGFDGTSNVVAGYKLGIPVHGTIAHSFVTSFSSLDDAPSKLLNGVNIKEKALEYRKQLNFDTNDGELASFITFAHSLQNNFTLLVDTYNTLTSGIPNFVCVALALQDAGCVPLGVRLDSGDLAELSKKAKQIFKKCGDQFGRDTSKWAVVASNDINEEALKQFNQVGHSIDVFGIGTNLVTCQKQPALGLVYKIVECKGLPTMKLSEDVDKITLPSQKQVYRLWFNDKDTPTVDVITTLKEDIKEGDTIRTVNRRHPSQRYTLTPIKVQKILLSVWQDNQSHNISTLEEAKQYAAQQLMTFDPQITRIEKPKEMMVLLSESYYLQFREKMESLLLPIQIN